MRWAKTNNGDKNLNWTRYSLGCDVECVIVTRRNVLEFAFCRLGVTTALASLLAQLGRGVLIGAGGMWVL